MQRLRAYGLWGSASGLAFALVYPTCNWLTSLRAHHYRIYFDWELSIPFYPEWVWVYLSMYLFFLAPPFFLSCAGLRRLGILLVVTTLASGAIFLALPATLGFERVSPSAGLLCTVFDGMFLIDKPHNLIPSLHVVWPCAIALEIAQVAASGWGAFFLGWAAAIALSTLLVHQHHLTDLLVAFALVMLARKNMGVPPQ